MIAQCLACQALDVVVQTSNCTGKNSANNEFLQRPIGCLSAARYSCDVNKGDEFLQKLWCCIGGRVQQGNLVLSFELIT